MTGGWELTAYCIAVPWIGANCGGPSYVTSSFAAERLTAAVCGIEFAISASFACGVPGTETSAFARALSGGIFAKSSGSDLAGTNSHGP